MDAQLNELLKVDRAEIEEVDPISELDDEVESEDEPNLLSEDKLETSVPDHEGSSEREDSLVARNMASPSIEQSPMRETVAGPPASYVIVDLGDCSSSASRFHDEDYRETLRLMAQKILSAQGPIREDVLASQIARAHGFKRTGGKIRDHILGQIQGCPATDEGSGRFLWSWDHPIEASIPFRLPADDLDLKENRSIAEISIAELCGLVQSNFGEMGMADDPVVFLARKIGVGRVSQVARTRIADAIDRARELGDVT